MTAASCRRGHVRTATNTKTQLRLNGYVVRQCRTCIAERANARYAADEVFREWRKATARKRYRDLQQEPS